MGMARLVRGRLPRASRANPRVQSPGDVLKGRIAVCVHLAQPLD
jgi:hypothetical protein